METLTAFIFSDSKITADGNCSHEIKRHFLLGRKTVTKLGSILKIKDITLPTQVQCSPSYGFSSSHVWMWDLNHKKAEGWRIHAFELWCWRRLLTVPWTARRSKQSILKEINLEYSLEGLMLKLQYFGHLIQRTNSLEKRLWCWERLWAGGEGDDSPWDDWMVSLTQWTRLWASSGRWWMTGKPGMLQSMGSQSRTWLNHWTSAIYW